MYCIERELLSFCLLLILQDAFDHNAFGENAECSIQDIVDFPSLLKFVLRHGCRITKVWKRFSEAILSV